MPLGSIIAKILNKLTILHFLNIKVSIILNKKKFKIPILGKFGYSNLYMSEPWMIELLSNLLKDKKSTFIDIGANIGQSLLKLRSVSSDINYIGFEPNSACVFYLENLIESNKFKNSSIIPVGISDQTQLLKLSFYSDSKLDKAASILPEFRPEQEVKSQSFVPIFSIESLDIVNDLKDISIVKIDVEGAELEVLKSLESTIVNHRPYILIEVLPSYEKENTFRIERQKQIESLLERTNFKLFRIKKKNDRLSSLEALEEFGIHSNLDECDYLLVAKEELKNIESLIKG